MMKQLLALTILFLVVGCTMDAHSQANHQPPNEYVPDAKIAIRIAIAVWSPIYGEKEIQGEKPYHAVLKHGTWSVTGSLPEPRHASGSGFRSVVHGGVALAEISKKDGRIIKVTHGK